MKAITHIARITYPAVILLGAVVAWSSSGLHVDLSQHAGITTHILDE